MKHRNAVFAFVLFVATPVLGQDRAPGEQGSRNVKVMSHVPLGGPQTTADIELEQELSRPYAYVSKVGLGKPSGFDVINLKNPEKAGVLWSWRIENAALHQGIGCLAPAYLKSQGRYYFAQGCQFSQGGPDVDLGAVVFDMTGLPDTTKIREVTRLKAPDNPGGFHELYSYKHSNGHALLFTTTVGPFARVYDIDLVASGGPNQGLVARVPIPENASAGMPDFLRLALPGYHDFYVGYDPANKRDVFYGGGAGGYYVYDVTDLQNPKLLTSVTGVAGVQFGHTFTPDPTGRYAIAETEYQYAPLRIFDLKPGLDGTTKNISRPIGAWTARWSGVPHNHEVRWPYVFVSHYEDGLQVFNMMDPANPFTVGFYDTYDGPNNKGLGAGASPLGDAFNGAFGVDVRNADGLIVISDIATGFWAFKMEGFDGWNGHQWGMPNVSSVQDWDNGPDGAPKPQRIS